MPEWTAFRRLPQVLADEDGTTGELYENSAYQVILRRRNLSRLGRAFT